MSKIANDLDDLLKFRDEMYIEYLNLKKKRDQIRIQTMVSLFIAYLLMFTLAYLIIYKINDILYFNVVFLGGVFSCLCVSLFVSFVLLKRLGGVRKELVVEKENMKILVEKIFEYYKYFSREMELSPIEELKFEMKLKKFRLEEDLY